MIKTVTGRLIPLPPKIRLDSNRKTINDVKKVNHWLLDQAKAEAVANNDEFNLLWINNEKIKNLPQASIDCLNVYLFGEICPDIEARIV